MDDRHVKKKYIHIYFNIISFSLKLSKETCEQKQEAFIAVNGNWYKKIYGDLFAATYQ